MMTRKFKRPFTFSDGTFLPAGTFVSVAGSGIHHDESTYAHPNEFFGFRFARMREKDREGAKYQFVNIGLNYISFVYGRNAW
jgi:cytochrome P450